MSGRGAVAPYSEIMKRSSGGVGGGPWRVWPGATAVLHKLTQELSRPILVPSLRHLKPPQLGDSTINYLDITSIFKSGVCSLRCQTRISQK